MAAIDNVAHSLTEAYRDLIDPIDGTTVDGVVLAENQIEVTVSGSVDAVNQVQGEILQNGALIIPVPAGILIYGASLETKTHQSGEGYTVKTLTIHHVITTY